MICEAWFSNGMKIAIKSNSGDYVELAKDLKSYEDEFCIKAIRVEFYEIGKEAQSDG